MAASEITGTHFTVSSKRIDLFENVGGRLTTTWFIDSIEMDPCPVQEDIISVIESDRASGKEDQIAYILISSMVAIRLFLEGVITQQHFQAAQETSDTIILRLPLAGKERVVKIRSASGLEYGISTRDAADNII
jgi:hypothetical protein